MEVQPSYSLGRFIIGMSISEAIEILQNSKHSLQVDIIFDEKDPLRKDLNLKIVNEGFQLNFDSNSQRLKSIQVYDLDILSLSYSGVTFTGKSTPSFDKIYQLFGPTFPGFMKENNYVLNYPGLTFTFEIPQKFQNLYKGTTQDIPIELPDGSTPIANFMIIYRGKDLNSMILPPLKDDNFYYEEVLINLGESIYLEDRKRKIYFNTSPQDVMSELGAPNQIFYKKHNKLKIHSKIDYSDNLKEQMNAVDYFYNYFSLGIDIMFDGSTHLVQKIILRTNFPGSKDFNVYKKCNFKLPNPKNSKAFITPIDKFDSIKSYFGQTSKPLVSSTSNPFGKTFFYAYKNCIFEILPNGYINSLTLFTS
eukprot:gene5410-9223_t